MPLIFNFIGQKRHEEKLYGWTIGRLGLSTCEIIVNSLYCVQL
jgi:hypothetical protein